MDLLDALSQTFDPAVPVGPGATPTDELVAFLGRKP